MKEIHHVCKNGRARGIDSEEKHVKDKKINKQKVAGIIKNKKVGKFVRNITQVTLKRCKKHTNRDMTITKSAINMQ